MLHTHSPTEEVPDNNITSLDTSQPEFFDSSMEYDDTLVSPSTSDLISDNSNLFVYVTEQSLPPAILRRILSSSTTGKSNPQCQGLNYQNQP